MIDVSVGGLPGKQTEYTLPVAGLIQETRVIYLKGAVCGWQILLQAYGSGQLAIYTPLFEAVVATFKPLAAG